MEDKMNIEEKMKQVPFGSSAFQIQHFVANQETPERTYRNVLLQLDSKRKAMKECYFRRKRKEIDIREINEQLSTAEGYDKERLLINLEEAEYQQEQEIKLIEDCVIEIKIYESILSELPNFSREEFEKSERDYWKKRLVSMAEKELLSTGTVGVGTLDSLEKIGCPVGKQINHEGNLQLVILEDQDTSKMTIL